MVLRKLHIHMQKTETISLFLTLYFETTEGKNRENTGTHKPKK
jgi:hypothetical protein